MSTIVTMKSDKFKASGFKRNKPQSKTQMGSKFCLCLCFDSPLHWLRWSMWDRLSGSPRNTAPRL